MNMITKREARITDKHFSLENNILTLEININDYDITGKQITAAFEPKGIETAPLTAETVEGVTTVSLPIYSSYIAEGVNYIQLYFRWDTAKLEQSGKMMWVVERSLIADDPGVEQQDLMSYYLQQMVLAIAEADRVVDEAGDVRVELDESTASATAINNTLADPATGTIKLATDTNATLSQSIIDAGIAKDALTDPVTGAIVLAEAAEDALTNPTTGAIKLAEDAKSDIEQAIIDNEIVTQTEFIAHKEETVQNFKIKNEVVNGDFSQGTIGWGASSPMSAENNELTITVNDTYSSGTRVYSSTPMQVEVGDKLYYRFEFKPEYISTFRLTFDDVNFIALPSPTVDVYKAYSGEHTLLTSANVRIRFNYYHGSNIGKKYRFKKVSVVNRTKIFGAGNEPTKLEMDELMKVIPNQWWDEELSLTQKQYVTWQLNLIRKNTNAIIALGGTIV